jgi:single-strand DNA-binding protein
VTGTLRSRPWEAADGTKRTSWEVRAEEVAASLLFATATINRRNSRGPAPEDPWAAPAAAQESSEEAPF